MSLFKLNLYVPLFTTLMLNVTEVSAQQTNDPFEQLEQEMAALEKEGSAEELKEFNDWKESYLSEYQDFRRKHFKKLDDIRDKLINTWGETDPLLSSQTTYYSPDNKAKTTIDYENDQISISILHNEQEHVSTKDISNALKSALNANAVVASKINSTSFKILKKNIENISPVETPVEVIAQPEALIEKEINKINKQAIEARQQVEKVFDMSLQVSSPVQLDSENLLAKKKLTAEIAKIESEKTQRIKSLKASQVEANAMQQREKLKNKRVTTYTIPLAHSSFIKKAAPYKNIVSKHSKRWRLPESLLFSIIHTESHFNTQAESPIPAFGLMQIVPISAGADVNLFLHKKKNIMSKEYLFNPKNNIETGVAYMHLLNTRYLAKISNQQSRFYCMIAAYNTGAGNVAKAFNTDNSRNINKASNIINKMTPEEVYNKLIRDLPYEETKKYLQKVLERQPIYKSMEQI